MIQKYYFQTLTPHIVNKKYSHPLSITELNHYYKATTKETIKQHQRSLSSLVPHLVSSNSVDQLRNHSHKISKFTRATRSSGSIERHMNSIIEYKLAREAKELSECSFQPNLCSGSGSTRSASRRFKQFYEDQLRLWENSKIIKANL